MFAEAPLRCFECLSLANLLLPLFANAIVGEFRFMFIFPPKKIQVYFVEILQNLKDCSQHLSFLCGNVSETIVDRFVFEVFRVFVSRKLLLLL